MNDGEHQFISELKREIGSHEAKDQIISEYKHHIYEMKNERTNEEILSYEQLVIRLGTPVSIAKMWNEEINTTPRKMQWLFVLINIGIFVGGAILTVCYHLLELEWIDQLWRNLINVPFVIMFVYLLFWGLLGYEIGREFGYRGHRLLQKTFMISIIPNILFMYLVVFKIFPHEWFEPLLNTPFIIICIIFTGLLYPVSMLGYRWGRKSSI